LPVRILVSLWLAYHVMAMFISPWAIPPTSRLAVLMQQYVAHYQTLLYLNHGYRFFAPDPGPASVVEFLIVRPDGQVTRGLFPDRQAINRDYPRLNYHRWFMWSETLGQMYGQWVDAAEFQRYLDMEQGRVDELRRQGLDLEAERLSLQLEEDRVVWQESETTRQAILTPVARVLLEQTAIRQGGALATLPHGTELRLSLNRRMIPSLAEARMGMRPSDPRLLDPQRGLELGRWRWNAELGLLELGVGNSSSAIDLESPAAIESLPAFDETVADGP
jgi:hypothetical protein